MLLSRRSQDSKRASRACACGFALWRPLLATRSCTVGHYDDARFPGRLIVSLERHFDFIEDVPDRLAARFMVEISSVAKVQREILQADRINVAILGNQVSHVHAHLIPRYSAEEALPHKAPWEDPRPRAQLSPERLQQVEKALIEGLAAVGHPVPAVPDRKQGWSLSSRAWELWRDLSASAT